MGAQRCEGLGLRRCGAAVGTEHRDRPVPDLELLLADGSGVEEGGETAGQLLGGDRAEAAEGRVLPQGPPALGHLARFGLAEADRFGQQPQHGRVDERGLVEAQADSEVEQLGADRVALAGGLEPGVQVLERVRAGMSGWDADGVALAQDQR